MSSSSSSSSSRAQNGNPFQLPQQKTQNHKRTRSQLQLPVFNVEFTRSPLKDARDAIRRLNAKAGARSTHPLVQELEKEKEEREGAEEGVTGAVDSGGSCLNEGRVDAGMDPHDPDHDQGVDAESSFCMDSQPSVEDEILLSPRKVRDTQHLVDTQPDPKRTTKRTRSTSTDSVPHAHVDSNVVDSNPRVASVSNAPKRPKLQSGVGTGPLDAFFSRQPALKAKPTKPDPLTPSMHSTPSMQRRVVSGAASPSLVPVVPATPTIKQLKAMPHLDLRTLPPTPSPRKPVLNVGLGLSSPSKSASKLRAISEGERSAASIRFHFQRDGSEDRLLEVNEENVDSQNQNRPLSSSTSFACPSSRVNLADVDAAESMILKSESYSNPQRQDAALARQSTATTLGPSQDPTAGKGHTTVSSSFAKLTSLPVPATPRAQITPTKKFELPSKSGPLFSLSPLPSRLTGFAARSDKDDIVEDSDEGKAESSDVPQKDGSSTLPPLAAAFPELTNAATNTQMSLASQDCQFPELPKTISSTKIVLGQDNQDQDQPGHVQKSQAENPSTFSVKSSGLSLPALPSSLSPSSGSHAPVARTSEVGGTRVGVGIASKLKANAKGRPTNAKSKRRPLPLPSSASTPRMRLTRAAVLRQKQAQQRALAGGSPVRAKAKSGTAPFSFSSPHAAPKTGADVSIPMVGKGDEQEKGNRMLKTITSTRASACAPDSPTRSGKTKKVAAGPQRQKLPPHSPRKTFVLTVPSSLSPLKQGASSSSSASSARPSPASSSTLAPRPLYPPPVSDSASKARSQHALSTLSQALQKLTMPPPAKPASTAGNVGARPSTSLGFTREMSAPVMSRQESVRPLSRQESAPRPLSRAGSVDLGKRTKSFLPRPPPLFSASGINSDSNTDKQKQGTNFPSMQFTFGGNGVGGGGAGSIRPPFRFGGATGRSTGGGIFGKPIPRIRASQKTSLETVEGSPVKGAASTVGRRRDGNESGEEGISIAPLNLQSTPVNAATINEGGDMSISTDGGKTEESGGTPDNMQTNGKELKKISKLNASRRASLAFSALTQSLNTPDSGEDRNENGPLGGGRSPAEPPSAGKQRAASATFSSSRPVRAASMRSFGVVNTAAGLSRSQSETMASAGPSAAPAAFNVSDSEGDSRSGKKGATGRSKMPGSLDILDQCTIFVDVRTEEGEDAGALFVDMLRGLGAKVLTRIGQSCTHIVYKNGLASTLTRYRLFDEPRPSVVGIGWVVECVEKRERVDETRHQVNLDGVNVAGTLKRRKSILPKQMSMNGPMDAFINGAIPTGSEKTVVNGDPMSEDGESSRDNINGSNLKSNLAPLEKARRRSTMFPRPLNG